MPICFDYTANFIQDAAKTMQKCYAMYFYSDYLEARLFYDTIDCAHTYNTNKRKKERNYSYFIEKNHLKLKLILHKMNANLNW